MSTVRMCADHVRLLRSHLTALGGGHALPAERPAADYAFSPEIGAYDLLTWAVGIMVLRILTDGISRVADAEIAGGRCLICATHTESLIEQAAKISMTEHLARMRIGGHA